MSNSTPQPAYALAVYTDEPLIGMDHPLFMAKTQARIWASSDAHRGTPLHIALNEILRLVRDLFGSNIPAAMILTEVTLTYANVAAALEEDQ